MSDKEPAGEKKKTFGVTVKSTFEFNDSPYSLLRKTRKEKKDSITNLYEHYATFRILALSASFYAFQVCLPYTKFSKKKTKANTDFEFSDLVRYNQVVTPTMLLCASEFYLFITELQAAGYNGAARTLRCMLETAVEACEFQTQENRPRCDLLLDEYNNVIGSKTEKQLGNLLVKYNGWASFIERYNVFEKMNRIAPTYRELINNLNARQLFSEAPQVLNELKSTYETLSDYVHPSSGKFLNAINKKTPPQLEFMPEDFDTMYRLGLKVLDCVEFVYLTTIANFFNSKESKKFLEYLSSNIEIPGDLANTFLTLPFSKKLCEGITFRYAEIKDLKKVKA
jgi:hypothetical protein